MAHRHGPRPDKEGVQWSEQDLARLERLAKGNTPTPLIADALGRTSNAIYAKASKENVSLKPTNKSPYNRRK